MKILKSLVGRFYREEVSKIYQTDGHKADPSQRELRVNQLFQNYRNTLAGRVFSKQLKEVIREVVAERDAKEELVHSFYDGYQRALRDSERNHRSYQEYVDSCNWTRGWQQGLSEIQEPTREQARVLSDLKKKRNESQERVESYKRVPEIALKVLGGNLTQLLNELKNIRNERARLTAEICRASDDKNEKEVKRLKEQEETLNSKEERLLKEFKNQAAKIVLCSPEEWTKIINRLLTAHHNYKDSSLKTSEEKTEMAIKKIEGLLNAQRVYPSQEVWSIVRMVTEEFIAEKERKIEEHSASLKKIQAEIEQGRILEGEGKAIQNPQILDVFAQINNDYRPYGGEKSPSIKEKSRAERVEELFVAYFPNFSGSGEEKCLIKAKIESFLISKDQKLVHEVKEKIKQLIEFKRQEALLQKEYIEFVGMDDVDAFKQQATADQKEKCREYERSLARLSAERDLLEGELNRQFPAFKKLEDLYNVIAEEETMNAVFAAAGEGSKHTNFNYDASVASTAVWEGALQALESDYADVEKLYQVAWPE